MAGTRRAMRISAPAGLVGKADSSTIALRHSSRPARPPGMGRSGRRMTRTPSSSLSDAPGAPRQKSASVVAELVSTVTRQPAATRPRATAPT